MFLNHNSNIAQEKFKLTQNNNMITIKNPRSRNTREDS